MRKEDIDHQLRELAFDFFYWFSRFEFALKENKFLKCNEQGKNAEPGWDSLVEFLAEGFEHTAETSELLQLNPKRQKVGAHSELEWKDVGFDDCKSELCRVVRLLKTVRNNLFHGGKHGAEGWDNPERTERLLRVGKSILDQLAQLADIESDYTQFY
ncbi:hypothetical protein DU002_14600 [Corallincola holothuriorum]|uniref:Uncharacterized protein n=1 Tax=Corallincola holothuriorum TaxID=2282215 RepID=A0A368N521_9GAMM|nr:hypothetical protein [Corallincola holothuriorum]RCU45687.1 hypothetical protein DU002_14600 [Corallincola holothuriorum]